MKGDEKVIEDLNKVLASELTAISQHFLHARMLKDWGLERLAEREYAQSIDEMRHADRLIQRTLFLDGLPNLQRLNELLIGANVPEVLHCDLKQEQRAMPVLRGAIAHCGKVEDFATQSLFRAILDAEEAHVDWLETQIELIDKAGLERYLAVNIR